MLHIKQNNGMSMPIVLVLIAIMLLLAITIVSVVDSDSEIMGRMDDSEQALHIAEAGYNHYLWALNDDTYFYRDGENDTFKIEDTYDGSENSEWDGLAKTYKPAKYVSGGKEIGAFQIEIIPPTLRNPVVGVKSTGWCSGSTVKRSVYVEVHKRQFTNYSIFVGTDGESDIFRAGSEVKGPFFTNGDLNVQSGAIFHDTVGYAGRRIDLGNSSSIYRAGWPTKSDPLQLPSTNNELKKWGEPRNGGLTYTGDTAILLNNSQIRVRTSDGNSEEKSLPDSGVVYVDGDLYISGVLDGRLTILAEGDIYICAIDPTDNSITSQGKYDEYDNTHKYGVTYANSTDIPVYNDMDIDKFSDDMLGLVTNKDVVILTMTSNWPYAGSGMGIITVKEDIYIHAALYCNTVRLQEINWDSIGWDDFWDLIRFGLESLSLNQIHYLGSRTVKVNTAPGTYIDWWIDIDWAYSSDNVFDYRMLYDAPPHFVEPANTGWEVRSWTES